MIIAKLKEGLVEFCSRPFLQNVIKLTSGNAVAQLVVLLCAPIITRLYTPADFGILSFLAGISGVLVLLATLRFDLALMLPSRDSSAWQLLALGRRTSLIVVAFTFTTLLLFEDQVIAICGPKTYDQMLIWLPVFVLSTSHLSLISSWAMRRKAFGDISKAVVTSSVVSNSCKIGAGIAGLGGWFLMCATFLQQVIQTLYLSLQLRQTIPKKGKENAGYLNLVKRYRSFPIWRTPQDIMAAMAANSPSVLLALYFGVQTVGFYILAYRVTFLPVSLIKDSFQKVFYQKLAELHASGLNLYLTVLKATLVLGLSCIPVALFLLFFGESLFALVFGSEWLLAGTYSKYLGILIVGFVASTPSVVAVTVLEKNRELFIYELFRTSLRLGIIVVGGVYLSAENVIAAFCVVSAIASVCLIILVLVYLRKDMVCLKNK